MDVEVILGNKIQFTRRLPNKNDIRDINNTKTFKIPINRRRVISYEESSSNEDDEDDDSSDSFEAMEEDVDEEDRLDSFNNSENGSNSSYSKKKMLRRYGNTDSQEEKLLYLLSNNKKPKKELTEEEIAKKTEQMRIRKLHAKKMLEEEKREAVERILNEDGKKLRERQKKLNEDLLKKTQAREEKYKFSLTKIKHKYLRDGKVYVRFPQGLLLPSVLLQKKRQLKEIPECDVDQCHNPKKYTDPHTKKNYCSVACYRILKRNIA